MHSTKEFFIPPDPLFVRQHLISLLDKELICFENGELVWDKSLIEKSNSVTYSLDSITHEKLKQLPESAQLALQVCACIGSKISFNALGRLLREICSDNTIINSRDAEDTSIGRDVISPAIVEGLLVTSQDGSSVSFIHDSVQSAAYSLLDSAGRARFHWRIGRILKHELSDPDPVTWSSDHLFAVANQFSLGWKCVEEFERFEVVDILIRAAEESKMVADFRGAHYFYKVALEHFLRHSDWTRHYRLCSDFHLMGAENALRADELHYSERWLNILDLYIKGSTTDELKALPIRIDWIVTRCCPEDAIYYGLKKLRSLLGIKITPRNLKLRTVVRPQEDLKLLSETN